MKLKANIQIWRAFACACVFMVHLGQALEIDGTLRLITDFGARGVQMFFIISGYLIANSFEKYGEQNIGLFIKKKMIKLLPLYYIVMLYYFSVHTFLLKNIPQDPTGLGWIRYIIPINGIVPATEIAFWDNLGATWTIPCFVFAYLVLPVCLKWIKNYKAASLLLLISFAARKALPLFCGWMGVLEEFCYFCEGVFIYFVCKDQKKDVAYILVSLMALLYIVVGRIYTNAYTFVFMAMVLATDQMEIQSGIVKKILAICDKYSYTLYLAHGIVFIHILGFCQVGRIGKGLIAVLGSALLTFVVYTYMESPVQRWLAGWIKKDKK